MKPLLILVATLLVALFSTGLCVAEDTALENRSWILVETDNFRVHSVLTEKRTAELIRQLEAMQVALGDQESERTYQTAVPTIIFALDKEVDYLSLGVPKGTVGYFVGHLRENAIVVLDNSEVQGVRTILHEYVHFLTNRQRFIDYPRWYEEGMAEYLSASQFADGVFEYGLPQKGRIAELMLSGWLPLEKLLEARDIDEFDETTASLFYSQSWLLVHYLNSLPDGERSLEEGLAKYAGFVLSGDERVAAFEKAFATSVANLEDELLKYLRDNDFQTRSVAMDTSMPGFSPTVSEIPKPEVQIALARMAMRFGNDEAAEAWFTDALSSVETRANAEAGLGAVLGSRGQVAQAEARFEAAIFLVSYDFRMWMDYAQFWAERVAENPDYKRRNFYAKRLEESLNNALTISDATPELNYLIAYSLIAQDKDLDIAIEFLIEAGEQSPADQASRLLLAQAYLYSHDFERAIEVAESVLRIEHDTNDITVTARGVIREARDLMRYGQ